MSRQHRVTVRTNQQHRTSTPHTAVCRDCDFVSNQTCSKPVAKVHAQHHTQNNNRNE